MKQYTSNSSHITLKAYKRNHKFCISVTYADGSVVTGQYLTTDKANDAFKHMKKRCKDLVLVK